MEDELACFVHAARETAAKMSYMAISLLPRLVNPTNLPVALREQPLARFEAVIAVSGKHGPLNFGGDSTTTARRDYGLATAQGGLTQWTRTYELPGRSLQEAIVGAQELAAELPKAGAQLPQFVTRDPSYKPDLDAIVSGNFGPPKIVQGSPKLEDAKNPFESILRVPVIAVVHDGNRYLGAAFHINGWSQDAETRRLIRPTVKDARTATALQDSVQAVVHLGEAVMTPDVGIPVSKTTARTDVPGTPLTMAVAGVASAAISLGLASWKLLSKH